MTEGSTTSCWTEVAPGFFTQTSRISTYGLVLPRRTNVIKLPAGNLWVQSPSKEKLPFAEPVADIVASNRYHTKYLERFRQNYPDARLWSVPGLAEKTPRLNWTGTLEAGQVFEETIEVHPLKGAPALAEHAFFHLRSRSLLITDLLIHLEEPLNWFTRLHARVHRAYYETGSNRMLKLMIRNREDFRTSLHDLVTLQPERVVLSHGPVIDGSAFNGLLVRNRLL